MVTKIAYDPVYHTVERDNFLAMIAVDRYQQRSDAFETIIARTNEHFWNPEDPDYIRFDESLDAEVPLLPPSMIVELSSAVADKLDERQKIQLINECTRWDLSNILHGEQGALALSCSLCDMFVDPGAQEYMANQVREEARHVHGFTKYIQARFGGRIYPAGDTLSHLLRQLVASTEVYEKVVGMQMLVEGLAMGAFATLHTHSNDPLLRRLCQLTMTDEAFHHKFGKIWAQSTMPRLDSEQHHLVEDWARQVFETLLFNLINTEQKRHIYAQFGLHWQWVKEAVKEVFTDADRRQDMQDRTNIFRVLIKTLLKAGIITERTQAAYAVWVDMDELQSEGDRMVGDEIAEDGLAALRDINLHKRKVVRKIAEL